MTSLDTFNQLAKWIGYVQTVGVTCGFLCFICEVLQHATADVSLMLVASKSDLEVKREVTQEDGMKVSKSYRLHTDLSEVNKSLGQPSQS